METDRTGTPDRDVVRCADVLGSFGVTAVDIRAQRREYRTTVPPGRDGAQEPLEAIIADVLSDARDRTTTVRRTICQSGRGLTCSARYAQTALARELEAVFETIGWSFDCVRLGPAANGRGRLKLTATDPKGRSRATTVTYPTTPLADDNLPAVLHAVDEHLLAGTDATVVLLSTGVDRWRAALIEESELETLRERYGPRISAFDRPLLPDYGLEAYGSEDGGSSDPIGISSVDPDDPGPWPVWALERADRRSSGFGATNGGVSESATVESLIDEAESDSETESERVATESAGTRTDTTDDAASSRTDSKSVASSSSSTSAPSTEAAGFEIRGGSPTVSRVSNDGDTGAGTANAESTDSSRITRTAQPTRSETDERRDRDDGSSDTDDFGTLSGSQKTARIGNDSFGTDDEFETESDRYRALGAALGAGGAVSVDGLLEDDEFIPELPAVESRSVRIEFAHEFDPAAVSEAKASAEHSGFEWVDSGSLETTRLSNG